MRILLTAIAVGLAAAATARADQAERVITVTGTATVYAKPDVARIHYGVRVSEPSADAVKDTLGKTTTAIDEAVKKLKLAGLTVTTAPVAIKQSSGNNPGLAAPVPAGGAAGPGLGQFLGFSSHTATIAEKDPDKLRTAVDSFVKAITEAGANTAGGEERENTEGIVFPGQMSSGGPKIVLGREDDSAAREQALQKAVEKAVRSAKAIAKGLGAGEVKVLSVTDAPEPEKSAPEALINIYGLESPSSAPRVPAGEVEVKVRVVVKCSY